LDMLKASAPLFEFAVMFPFALVRYSEGTTVLRTHDESVGFRRGSVERVQVLYPKLTKVLEELRIERPRDYDRLSSSLRYFRLGFSEESTSEVRFLNLWIGLEYLLNVDGYDNEISAIRDLLPTGMSLGFFSSRLKDLYADLTRIGVGLHSILGVTRPPRNRPKAMLKLLQNEDLLDRVKRQIKDNPLARLRVEEAAKWANDSRIAMDIWESHVHRVTWQVQRLYRTRNSIVHSGTRDNHLVLLTSNLQEYLEQAIWLVVDNIGKHNFWSIDQTFRELKILYDSLRGHIQASKAEPLTPDRICFPFSWWGSSYGGSPRGSRVARPKETVIKAPRGLRTIEAPVKSTRK